jgi:hypothetical protein
VLGALLTIELASRLFAGVFIFSIDNLVARELSTLRWADGPYIFDERLGWRLKPRTVYPGQGRPDGKLTIGALGLRGAHVDARRIPEGALLVVGESQTLGVNVDDADTWPGRLGILLGRPVLNGATWSWGLDQIVLRVEELVPPLRPRTIVVALTPQAVAATDYLLWGLGYKPYFDVVDGNLQLAGLPVPLMTGRPRDIGWPQAILGYSHPISRLMRGRRVSRFLRWATGSAWIEHARRAHGADRSGEIACLLMQRLASLQRRLGVRVLVVMEYGAAELLGPRAAAGEPPVLACGRAQGLETLDTFAPLHAMAQADPAGFRRLWQMYGSYHGPPSAEGNALVADLVRKALD